MPAYDFRCKFHGLHEETGSMADPPAYGRCPECGEVTERVYTGFGLIMRPDGYSLKPGDRDYWNFNRQQELHQLRGGTTTDEKRLDASLFERPAPPRIVYAEKQMRELRAFGEMFDREVRENSMIPSVVREDAP